MRVSTFSVRWFGLLLFLTAGTVGCAQSGTGVPTSLTSPSSLSSAIGPGASYDATGMWHFVTTFPGNPDESADAYVTQDADGNLSFVDDGEVITLERIGTGVIITYRLSHAGPESGTACDVLAQGTGQLDTRTNTLTVKLMLRELGCSHQVVPGIVVTGTKLS